MNREEMVENEEIYNISIKGRLSTLRKVDLETYIQSLEEKNKELEQQIKQLTIDELREQFENETDIPSQINWDGEDYMYYGEDQDLNLMLDEIRVRWYGWRCCARANNLIKE